MNHLTLLLHGSCSLLPSHAQQLHGTIATASLQLPCLPMTKMGVLPADLFCLSLGAGVQQVWCLQNSFSLLAIPCLLEACSFHTTQCSLPCPVCSLEFFRQLVPALSNCGNIASSVCTTDATDITTEHNLNLYGN